MPSLLHLACVISLAPPPNFALPETNRVRTSRFFFFAPGMFFFFLLATGFFETWVVGSEIKVSFKTRAALDEKVSPRFSAGVYNATLFSFLLLACGEGEAQ